MSKVLIVGRAHLDGKLIPPRALRDLPRRRSMRKHRHRSAVRCARRSRRRSRDLDGVGKVLTGPTPPTRTRWRGAGPAGAAYAAGYTQCSARHDLADLMPCVAALIAWRRCPTHGREGAHPQAERYTPQCHRHVSHPRRRVVGTVRTVVVPRRMPAQCAVERRASRDAATHARHRACQQGRATARLQCGASRLRRPRARLRGRVIDHLSLADKLGAGVGASRAAVDADTAPTLRSGNRQDHRAGLYIDASVRSSTSTASGRGPMSRSPGADAPISRSRTSAGR